MDEEWEAAERALIQVSSELLGLESADPSDSFVQLGGDSLSAIKVVSRLRRDYGLALEVSALLRPVSFAELAQQCLT